MNLICSYGVTVSTPDFLSGGGGSIPPRSNKTFNNYKLSKKGLNHCSLSDCQRQSYRDKIMYNFIWSAVEQTYFDC